MCGIAGILFHQGTQNQTRQEMEARLALGARTLTKRGPDGEGFLRIGRLSLHHHRLAIVDPTATGQQPLQTQDGRFTLGVNGEIYNYKDLLVAEKPPPPLPEGRGDSRSILALAHQPWSQLPAMLEGMYAFALYDQKTHGLLLARDPQGQKPLFVYESEFGICFGSTISSLLPLLPEKKINEKGLASYLLGQGTAPPATIVQGIRSLAPGSSEVWRNKECQRSSTLPLDNTMTSEGFSATLDKACAKRLLGNPKPVILLSGGLDSAAIAESLLRQSGQPLEAFCLGFDDLKADERKAAQVSADALGIPLHTFSLPTPNCHDLEILAQSMGEPLADSSALALFRICQEIGSNNKVAFTGDGGDELLGGYDRHWHGARGAQAPWRHLYRLGSLFISGRRGQKLLACAQAKDGAEALYNCQALASSPLIREFLHPKIVEAVRQEEIEALRSHLRAHPQLTLRQQLLLADRATNLPRDLLIKADRCSMAVGVELRSPFLDQDLLRWQQSRMLEDRNFPRRGKEEIKEHLLHRLPQHILNRPKQGFALPLEEWMAQGPLRREAMEVLSDHSFKRRELCKPEVITDLFLQAKHKRGLGAELIYALVMLHFTLNHFNM